MESKKKKDDEWLMKVKEKKKQDCAASIDAANTVNTAL